MLINILLVVELLVGIALTGVVLLQRSEGGALGMGGGPSGFMTARGAGDFLTRVTWILGGTFFALALLLTILQGRAHGGSSVADRIKIDAVDPSALVQPKPAAAPPAGQAPATAPQAAPAPIQAPTPTVRNPFLDGASAPAPAPSAPPAQ